MKPSSLGKNNKQRPSASTTAPKRSSESSSVNNLKKQGKTETGEDISASVKLDVCTTFEDMGLNDDLLRGIYQYGFTKPSAIQQRAIKPITQGNDLIAQSQSGTGKFILIKWLLNDSMMYFHHD